LPKSPLRFTNRDRCGLCLYSRLQCGRAAARRNDHKYAPGNPVSFDGLSYKAGRIADVDGGIASVPSLSADMEQVLMALTELQGRNFLMDICSATNTRRLPALKGSIM